LHHRVGRQSAFSYFSVLSVGHGVGTSFIRQPIRDRSFDFGRNHCSPSQPACYLTLIRTDHASFPSPVEGGRKQSETADIDSEGEAGVARSCSPPIEEEPARMAAIYVPAQVTRTNHKNDYFSRILGSLRKSIFMGDLSFSLAKRYGTITCAAISTTNRHRGVTCEKLVRHLS
jgi:hypothetical protein